MNVYKLLGVRVRQKRKQLDLSQEQLSELCGISSAYIGVIERGHRKLSVDTLVKIANALNVNAGYLLRDSISFDSSDLIDKTTDMLNDMDEDEIRYAYELVSNAKKFINKKK